MLGPFGKNKKFKKIRKGLSSMRSAASSPSPRKGRDALAGLRMRGAGSARTSLDRKMKRKAKDYKLNRLG